MIKTAVLKISNIEKGTIFWVLIVVLSLLLGLYIYFVTQTILNTASYEIIEQKITTLDSDISELEFKHLSLKRDVNLSLAKALGYIETSDVKFINKSTSSKTLSLIGKIN